MRSVRARAAASPAIEMLAGIAIGVIIFYGGYQSTQGNLTAGEFMGFISALLMAYQPLRAVANLQTVLQEGVSAGERIFTVLDASDEIIDMTDAPSLDIQHGAIGFENVTLDMPDATHRHSTASHWKCPPDRPSRWSGLPDRASRPF